MAHLRQRQTTVRPLHRDDANYLAGVQAALDVADPPDAGAPTRRDTVEFLDTAARRGLTTDVVAVVSDGAALRFACLLVESPGHAALLVAPWGGIDPGDAGPVRDAIAAALSEAAARRTILVEALVAGPNDTAAGCLERSGFRRLTQLVYLQRRASLEARSAGRAGPLDWFTYTPAREALFIEALERSYSNSLDCPELCGLRSTRDVLLGHRASGDYDPSLWSVACRDGTPVGVLLLGTVNGVAALEVVYMGVAQVARGTGVSDALLGRAVDAVPGASANGLALAVDSRNTPARRLYTRWGFVETARRDAWIATPVVA